MYEPQRLLSRLNPIAVDWKSNIATTGDVLRAEDIAACLAGLEQGPYLLVLYLWAGDSSVITELHGLLLSEIQTLAYEQKWKCKDDSIRLLALIQMALGEMKKINLCKPCHGTGVAFNQFCNVCNGTGHRRRKYSEYAKHCGVKVANWKKCWDEKYYQVQLVLQGWESMGVKHLLGRL